MMWYRRCQWCYLICCLVLQLTHFRPHLKYEPQPIILYQLPFLSCILLRYTPIYVHCLFENNNNSRSGIVLRISTNTKFMIAWCFTVNLIFFLTFKKHFNRHNSILPSEEFVYYQSCTWYETYYYKMSIVAKLEILVLNTHPTVRCGFEVLLHIFTST